jgi:hypothetical protein
MKILVNLLFKKQKLPKDDAGNDVLKEPFSQVKFCRFEYILSQLFVLFLVLNDKVVRNIEKTDD